MSFERNKISQLKENNFGVQDTLSHGLLNIKTQLAPSHALEAQEKNFGKFEDANLMAQLKLSQGLYAPFKLTKEREFATKIGRLPCLKSSNLMLSVLKGTDETLEIEDIFNNQKYFCEYNTDPHTSFNSKF